LLENDLMKTPPSGQTPGPSEKELDTMLVRTSPTLFDRSKTETAFLTRMLEMRRILAALPAKPVKPSLVFVKGDSNAALLEQRAIGRGLTVGRGADSDWQLEVERQRLSNRHFRIERSGAEYVLTDLNSTNGTLLNEIPHRIKASLLRDGDFIHAGGCTFLFVAGEGG
jgi:FHA domain